MSSIPPVYVQVLQDRLLLSNVNGTARTVVISPKGQNTLSYNLDNLLVGTTIRNSDPNFRISIKWQWSLDGQTWNDGDTIINGKTSLGDSTGTFANNNQLTPFGRLIAIVDHSTGGSSQVTGTVNVWAYYKYRP